MTWLKYYLLIKGNETDVMDYHFYSVVRSTLE